MNLSARLNKTEAGRAEIRARRLDLPRPARNLLLIVDATRAAGDWLAMVQGAGEADLARLLDEGLVQAATAGATGAAAGPVASAATAAPSAAPAPAIAAAPASTPSASASTPPAGRPNGEAAGQPLAEPAGRPMVAPVAETASFRALYDYLTAQARPRLGLLKGYRTVLDIERAPDVQALRRCAEAFLEAVREAQGDAAADTVRRELAALG